MVLGEDVFVDVVVPVFAVGLCVVFEILAEWLWLLRMIEFVGEWLFC